MCGISSGIRNGRLVIVNNDGESSNCAWILLNDSTDIRLGVGKNIYINDATYKRHVALVSRTGLEVNGTFTASGTKSRAVDTESYGTRLLYCDEMPSPTFSDWGSGTLGPDGLCYVAIDDIFSETARTDLDYVVLITKRGPGDIWVSDKRSTHFVVQGTAGLSFDWEVKARQIGYECERIEDIGQRDVREEVGMQAISEADAYEEDLDYVGSIEALYGMETA